MSLTLRVITPTRQLVDTEVEEVTAPGAAGEFGVLPEHVTFVGALADGILTYVERGARKRVLVFGGYAEVAEDIVTVLADDAELPEEIDRGRARDELARIERELAGESGDPERVVQLLREQRRAELRASAGA